jgi:hypothetical protein
LIDCLNIKFKYTTTYYQLPITNYPLFMQIKLTIFVPNPPHLESF